MNFEHSIQSERIQEEQEQEGKEEEEEKACCEWNFNLRTIVSSNCVGTASDTIGVIEFDPSNQLIATGGIARKIRIYSIQTLLQPDTNQGTHNFSLLDHTNACEYYICTPAKLSSIRWKPGTDARVVGSGDYDGVVTEYDLEKQVPIFERDEHGGRKVWSLDYSHLSPVVGASGSDDGTMQVWDTRCDGTKCVARVQPSGSSRPVCCVEFEPSGNGMIGLGCADRNAYTYDVRSMSSPVAVLHGHDKPVSYVRYLSDNMMVSAGTDGCLKLWDVSQASVIRTYKGHDNSRSFVGLSVWRNGGLFGCGSESNEVFVYDKRWSDPIWVDGLQEPLARPKCEGKFVSSVCWRQVEEEECTLVAGGCDGNLQVFVGQRRSSSSFGDFSHSPNATI